MTAKKLTKKLKFTQEQLDKIRESVKEVEKTTEGEVALALASESSTYAEYELFASIVVGIIVFCGMIPFAQQISNWLATFAWTEQFWQLPLFYGSISFGIMAICYRLFNFVSLDRLIVPKNVREKAVYKRALQYFSESGIFATKKHTGILIFVSYLERRVHIMADVGIAAKIPQEAWDDIAFGVSKGFLIGTASSITDSYVEAVKRCGILLQKNFPATSDNPNEFKDNLVFVDNGLVVFNEK